MVKQKGGPRRAFTFQITAEKWKWSEGPTRMVFIESDLWEEEKERKVEVEGVHRVNDGLMQGHAIPNEA